MMNFRGETITKLEYYKGNELSAGSLEVPNDLQDSSSPETRSVVEGKNGEEEAMSRERERQLELWMENVKAFIREIDVSSL